MGKQVSFSLKDSFAKVRKSLENLPPQLEEQANKAISDLAASAYASITASAQARLRSTRPDYLKGLSFEDLGNNSFLISLEGDWAAALEDGFPPFDMTSGMLASHKTVEVGKRSGQPWVQQSVPQGKNQESHRFAHVPVQRNPYSKATKTANLADAIKQMTAMNSEGRKQKLTSLFKDPLGNPLEGKVAIGKSEESLVDNLVKYQKTYTNESGKKTTQSIYVNYRTISEIGKPWIHSGFVGLRAFQDAERDLVANFERIMKIFE